MNNLISILELEDRTSKNLNKKTLQIEGVVRDEFGEITELQVKEVRNDNSPTNEGTPLNASSMRRVINDLIKISKATNSERVSYDQSKLVLPETLKSSIELSQEGYAGSIITWQIQESSEYASINGNILEINRSSSNELVTLQASISYENVTLTKQFEITILKALTEMEKLDEDVTLLTLPAQITSNLELPLIGENGSIIKWEALTNESSDGSVFIKNKNLLKVTRSNDNSYITLKATISRPNLESVIKIFNITILGYPTTFYPTEYNENLIQGTTLNNKSIDILSSNNQTLYLEVENDYEVYIKTTITNNETTSVKVTFDEQQALNERSGSGSLLFLINIKVYTDSNKENLIGEIPCHIYYYFLSTEPED